VGIFQRDIDGRRQRKQLLDQNGESACGTRFAHMPDKEGGRMSRKIGDRFKCEKCGAVVVYEKPCPCPEKMKHSEICCGEQMKAVKDEGK
jgi:hypothetical protein